MALKLYERYPQLWESPSNDYPQGAFKNLSDQGETDGSYLEKDWLNDYSGFFGALLKNAQMTPNGTVDTAQRSQFYDALVKVAKSAVADQGYATKTYVDNKFNEVPKTEIINNWDQASDENVFSAGFVKDELGYVTPEMFGAVGDGITDDTPSLLLCISKAKDLSIPILGSKDYLVSGASLIDVWVEQLNLKLTDNASAIEVGGNLRGDLEVVSDSAASAVLVKSVSDVYLNSIKVKAHEDNLANSIVLEHNYKINSIISENAARPLASQSSGKSINLGSLTTTHAIRGLNITGAVNVNIDTIKTIGEYKDSEINPGHNGVLIQDAKFVKLGDVLIEGSGEHGFRIGGAASIDISINSLKVANTGGCAFKVNPNSGRVNNLFVGSLEAIDIGRGKALGNTECLRLSHIENVYIGSLVNTCNAQEYSASNGIILNDVGNLHIGFASFENLMQFPIKLDDRVDGEAGDVLNITIDTLICRSPQRALIEITMLQAKYGNVRINAIIEDTTEASIVFNGSGAGGGVIDLDCRYLQNPTNMKILRQRDVDDVKLNIHYKGISIDRFNSNPDTLKWSQVDVPMFSPYDKSGLLLDAPYSDDAGASLQFKAHGSNRRGGALVTVKTGSNARQIGLAFYGSTSATASEALSKSVVMNHDGSISLRSPNGDMWKLNVSDSGALSTVRDNY